MGESRDTVLITGASGLLGRALIAEAEQRGLQVLGQFHRSAPAPRPGVSWLPADFSSPTGVAEFLARNRARLAACTRFIHAYGPITAKATEELNGSDFLPDLQGNVLAAADIFSHLRGQGNLRSAVFLGFDDAGRMRPYRRVLAYAAAKNALLLLVLSWAAAFPEIRVNMVSPTTVRGAALVRDQGRQVSAQRVARVVWRTLLGAETGRNHRIRR